MFVGSPAFNKKITLAVFLTLGLKTFQLKRSFIGEKADILKRFHR